jgi:hypothetical protein
MIGTCHGLVDLAIDSDSHMTIWAVSSGGVATVWKIDDGSQNVVERRWVVRDGTVRESEGDGDVEMSDAPPTSPDTLPCPVSLQEETFDGTSSFLSTVVTTRSARRHRIEWSQHSVQYDADGDVLMDDMLSQERSHEGAVDEFVLEHDNDGALWYQRHGWSRQSYRRLDADLVEELTGITRIDLLIH